jgi:hypothetical protein
MGCARDIVEHVGVPRFFWSDFPLGHSAGKPKDTISQIETLKGALSVLSAAKEPRTTVKSPQNWSENESWKEDFLNIERLSQEEIHRLKEAYRMQKATGAKLKSLDTR